LYYNEIICNAEWVFIMGMMSMRLPDELSEQLDALAAATGRSKSFLAGQAIRDFIERESWQIAEITQVIQEADAGDFASDDELNAVSAKWSNNAG
jgi:RHH-type rel operon transcriptional repressor/antitoxin RelB